MIFTSIHIDASTETVWQVLTDFAAYPSWNPFIRDIEGRLEVGQELAVALRLGRSVVRIRPIVRVVEPGVRFHWEGHLLVRGLFDGTHRFTLHPEGPDRTRLVHDEVFEGWLVRLLLPLIRDRTQRQFQAMNVALADRCAAVVR